jgi:hypothetical protein
VPGQVLIGVIEGLIGDAIKIEGTPLVNMLFTQPLLQVRLLHENQPKSRRVCDGKAVSIASCAFSALSRAAHRQACAKLDCYP